MCGLHTESAFMFLLVFLHDHWILCCSDLPSPQALNIHACVVAVVVVVIVIVDCHPSPTLLFPWPQPLSEASAGHVMQNVKRDLAAFTLIQRTWFQSSLRDPILIEISPATCCFWSVRIITQYHFCAALFGKSKEQLVQMPWTTLRMRHPDATLFWPKFVVSSRSFTISSETFIHSDNEDSCFDKTSCHKHKTPNNVCWDSYFTYYCDCIQGLVGKDCEIGELKSYPATVHNPAPVHSLHSAKGNVIRHQAFPVLCSGNILFFPSLIKSREYGFLVMPTNWFNTKWYLLSIWSGIRGLILLFDTDTGTSDLPRLYVDGVHGSSDPNCGSVDKPCMLLE